MRRATLLIAMLGARAVSADPAAPAVVASAAPADALAPVPVEAAPAAVEPAAPVVTSVPAGRRLSPRNDVVMAAYSTRHSDDLEIRDLRLKAAVPVVRGGGYGGALLLGYGKTHLELAEATGPDDARTLHRFEAAFGGGAAIAPGWSLRGSAGAAFSSDLSAATIRQRVVAARDRQRARLTTWGVQCNAEMYARGIVARRTAIGRTGYDSARCGRLIRKAWLTGTPQ